jgi:SAM-dependent methyltransferase
MPRQVWTGSEVLDPAGMTHNRHMNSPASGNEAWSGGSAYESYVGRWSALVAPEFLRLLAVEPDRRWLDVGCGTGVLTRAILADAAPRSVLAIDPSEPFLAHARKAVVDRRVTFRTGTAAETGLADSAVDAVVFGLVLNYVPDVAEALGEARRVVTPNGVVGTYIWDYADGMRFIRAFWDAAVAQDPAAVAFDQGRKYAIAAPDPLSESFADAGLASVEVEAIVVPTTFADFDDFWTPFTRGTGQAPVYVASLEPGRRDALRERLRSSLPIEPDGQIHLSARAWACLGRART